MQIIAKIKSEIRKVVVGQDKMIEALLAGLLTRGTYSLRREFPDLLKQQQVNALGENIRD